MTSKNKIESDLDITPETKVGELLNNYPLLEDELIKLAPAFAKLKNPILRKTVGRVATLKQAAQVGNVPISKMINALRGAAGLQAEYEAESDGQSGIEEKPEWIDSSDIAGSLDARKMIEDGEQPIGIVMKELKSIPPGKIFKLITPFYPAPLADMAIKKGYKVWATAGKNEITKTYFYKVDSDRDMLL